MGTGLELVRTMSDFISCRQICRTYSDCHLLGILLLLYLEAKVTFAADSLDRLPYF